MNDVTPELKRFLDFVAGRIKADEHEDTFIKILDEKVNEVKENTKWRREFMLLLNEFDVGFLEGSDEGFNKGRNEEKRSIYERLTAGGMSPQEAAAFTGWNTELEMKN